jgi:hypothetical protein
LFSAILTAFIVEAFQGLQEDNSATSALLLQRMYTLQLYNSGLVSAPPDPDEHVSSFAQGPSSTMVLVNVFWFSSLLISLFSALLGIFVKQWLRNYNKWDEHGSHEESVKWRGLFLRGFEGWHVPDIVTTLPTMVQIALALFLAGLLIYVRSVNHIVGTALTVLLGSFTGVVFLLILLPVVFPSCPYKSPLVLFLLSTICRSIISVLAVLSILLFMFLVFVPGLLLYELLIRCSKDNVERLRGLTSLPSLMIQWLADTENSQLQRILPFRSWRALDLHRTPFDKYDHMDILGNVLGLSPRSLVNAVFLPTSLDQAIGLNRIHSLSPDIACQIIADIIQFVNYTPARELAGTWKKLRSLVNTADIVLGPVEHLHPEQLRLLMCQRLILHLVPTALGDASTSAEAAVDVNWQIALFFVSLVNPQRDGWSEYLTSIEATRLLRTCVIRSEYQVRNFAASGAFSYFLF